MPRSKPIIDEIDRVLARHYGFTDEELDFIVNYNVKYRMGRERRKRERKTAAMHNPALQQTYMPRQPTYRPVLPRPGTH